MYQRRYFKTIRCKKFLKEGKCYNRFCPFAHKIIYYNRLPGIFSRLKYHYIPGFGILDGHIVEFE